MSLSTPKAILFDWDNTLVDTWPTIHTAFNVLMRTMGHEEWTLERTKSQVKKSMRDAFPAMFGDQWEDASRIYQEAYRAIHLEQLASLPDAEAVLQWVKGSPLYVAAVSNKRGDNLRKEIDHIGWTHYFDAIVGAGDADADKPDPAPVHLALRDVDIEPAANVWFIGDTSIDLETAQNTGCTPVLYGDVEPEGVRYGGFPIALHVRNHKALIDIFNALN